MQLENAEDINERLKTVTLLSMDKDLCMCELGKPKKKWQLNIYYITGILFVVGIE